METRKAWTARQAIPADEGRLRQLIARAERVALRFQVADLTDYLTREPFLVAEEGGSLRGFLAFFVHQPPQATLVAAALADGCAIFSWLDLLLPRCITRLQAHGVKSLSYVGSATWLAESLQKRGFRWVSYIVTYEKTGWAIPEVGSQTVQVRDVRLADFPVLVSLDELDFHPLWRNSQETLRRWRATLPYFVVAVAEDEPVGYCYCSVGDEGHGHLIRMAVHPAWQGRGIGTRLVAEAVEFFQQAGVPRITLNTQEENTRARRLYRKFGFRPIGREAVALWRDL
jgi:ribosomal protein S18 acetylase RimI-like enzyme